MPSISATAPAKVILLGEHAVVYNQPAIAFPVPDVRARVAILANPPGKPGHVEITSRQVQLQTSLDVLPPEHAFQRLFTAFQRETGLKQLPAMQVTISSEIPVAAGMGSGAAVSVAMLKALGLFVGIKFSNAQLAAMAYEAEKAYHGNPSGIDNTVIACEKPVYFKKNEPITFLTLPSDFNLLIAYSGIPAQTIATVNAVRAKMEQSPVQTGAIIEQIGTLVRQARVYVEAGDVASLGRACTQNQSLLMQLGVSTPKLENLVNAAINAGALGAKLTGGGGGGNILALVNPEIQVKVMDALYQAGAERVFPATVRKTADYE